MVRNNRVVRGKATGLLYTVNRNPVHFGKRVWTLLESPWRRWELLAKEP